jgi:hypothetical protein
MKELDALFYNEQAPLSTFYGRIMVGHAIGIYGMMVREELDVIRRVRNVFAHAMRPLSFSHPFIAKEVRSLRPLTLSDIGLIDIEEILAMRARFVANCLDYSKAFRIHALQCPKTTSSETFPDWSLDAPAPLLHKFRG